MGTTFSAKTTAGFFFGLVFLFAVSTALAWSGPSAPPPDNSGINVPIHIGPVLQQKQNALGDVAGSIGAGTIFGSLGSFGRMAIGAGMSTPTGAVLHVKGTGNQTIRVENISNNSRISFMNAAGGLIPKTNEDSVLIGSTGNDFSIYTGNGERMHIAAGGNVGVGDYTNGPAPAERLEVKGNIKASGTICAGTDCLGGSSSGIPQHAVMAFNLAACPDGWSPLANAAGRVVVGAGTYPANADFPDASNPQTSYSLGQLGGEMNHVLTYGELAAHTHTYSRAPLDGRGGQQGSDGRLYMNPAQTETAAAGSNEAHENRPPYLALLYCEKD